MLLLPAQDEEDDYTGEPLSKWVPGSNPAMAKNEDPAENRAVFVVRGGWGRGVLYTCSLPASALAAHCCFEVGTVCCWDCSTVLAAQQAVVAEV
jgi:hypothetical protein